MFVVWAFLSGFAGDLFAVDSPDEIQKLQSRTITPGRFFLESCDGKFIDDDLNDEGNAFTQAYFDFEKGKYISDYEAELGEEVVNLYYVKDSWENFDRLRPVLDRRFADWRTK